MVGQDEGDEVCGGDREGREGQGRRSMGPQMPEYCLGLAGSGWEGDAVAASRKKEYRRARARWEARSRDTDAWCDEVKCVLSQGEKCPDPRLCCKAG